MPSFVTLYNIENVHLTKDVGLIPYGMFRYFNYDASCATYDNGDYSNLTYVDGLKLRYIQRITGNFTLDSLFYLFRHAGAIDILNVYHFHPGTAFQVLLYKSVHPEGIVYWKVDGGRSAMKDSSWKRRLYRRAMRKTALISCELEENCRDFKKFWGDDIPFAYIPNPYHPDFQCEFTPYAQRSNWILSVGRVGSHPKATDVLIRAFSEICDELEDWELHLVGPKETKEIQYDFDSFLNRQFEEHPGLEHRVVLHGPIYDRDALIALYSQSKIFAMPSRWESFGFAGVEAALCGDYFVGTDIPSLRALTENYSLGSKCTVDNVSSLADALLDACGNIQNNEGKARKLQEICRKKYSLQNIITAIHGQL